MSHLPSYLHPRGFLVQKCDIYYLCPIFTPPFFFYKFATYLQGENWCKSILGLWYFQGYIFQPGIYGILRVLEGYRVISILM